MAEETASLLDVLGLLEPHLHGPAIDTLCCTSREALSTLGALQPPGVRPAGAWSDAVQEALGDERWLRWVLEHGAPYPLQASAALPPIVREAQRELEAAMECVRVGDAQGLRTLLHGARFHVLAYGGLLLILAVQCGGRDECVRVLLHAIDRHASTGAASVNAHDELGRTALMRAAAREDIQSVQLLLEAGADVEARDHSGRTALMWAAEAGDEEAVEMLLSHGADLHRIDTQGRDALLWAAAGNRPRVALQLVRRGARATRRDHAGHSAHTLCRFPVLPVP